MLWRSPRASGRMVAIRPALSPPGRAMVEPLVGRSASSPDCLVNGLGERKSRHAVDGSKMVIRNADCIAGADLALSGTVHVNDSAVAVSEIDTGGERIQCCL